MALNKVKVVALAVLISNNVGIAVAAPTEPEVLERIIVDGTAYRDMLTKLALWDFSNQNLLRSQQNRAKALDFHTRLHNNVKDDFGSDGDSNSCSQGNPIHVANGTKTETEYDFSGLEQYQGKSVNAHFSFMFNPASK
ncbi:hypothetical protein, partial [Arsukibacterium sp.]|uniref:hypothetical protein n=1 Tax=Arsukibacterium sp. TaxID=1977258 RepID=UPI002FDB2DC4